MTVTVSVDADDLAYVAELASRHLRNLGWPMEVNTALDPIFRSFRALEGQAPGTFAHHFALWGAPDEIDEEGLSVSEHDDAVGLVIEELVALPDWDWDDEDVAVCAEIAVRTLKAAGWGPGGTTEERGARA